MFDPHFTAAEWYLGGLSGEDLAAFAIEAIEKGHEGKNLAQLAALARPTKRDVEELVDGALREVGVAAPLSEDEAALWILAWVKASANSPNLTTLNLVGKLLAALPELESPYVDEVKSYYGLPGNYWVVSVVWRPLLKVQIAQGKDSSKFVARSAAFMEQVCGSEDQETINVLWIEIFEWLVHSSGGELKFLWPVLGPLTKAVIRDVARRRNELQNLP